MRDMPFPSRRVVAALIVIGFVGVAWMSTTWMSTMRGMMPVSNSASMLSVSVPVPATTSTMPQTQEVETALVTPLVEQARRYELNLVEMFDAIRSRCLPEWDRENCNSMARKFLFERTPDNGKEELLAIFDQYTQYEDYIAVQRPLSYLDLENTYQTLQQLRTRYFDEEMRAWLFGPEDARMRYEFALREFLENDARRLPPLERLRQLEKLRQINLGDFYPLFASHESGMDYYQQQLEVLELEKPASPEAASYAAVIREKMDAVSVPGPSP